MKTSALLHCYKNQTIFEEITKITLAKSKVFNH